ncbi:venom allergen-like protein vap-2, partial [Aphelenchoides avenae]
FRYLCLGVESLTAAERTKVVQVHNAYRSQLAKGQITNKGGKKLPTGKNIYALRYDLNAEKLAQTTVNTCSGGSSGAKLNFRMGGNVDATTLITNAVSVWAGTLQTYGVGADLKFTKANPSLYYWAELAYAVNYKVGCATKYCAAQGFTWIVCQYQPK